MLGESCIDDEFIMFVVVLPSSMLKLLAPLGFSFLDAESVDYFENVTAQVLESVGEDSQVSRQAYL